MFGRSGSCGRGLKSNELEGPVTGVIRVDAVDGPVCTVCGDMMGLERKRELCCAEVGELSFHENVMGAGRHGDPEGAVFVPR